MPKKKNKTKKNTKRIAMIAFIVVAVIVLALIIKLPPFVNNASKSSEYPSAYSEDTCACIARERLKCPDDSWKLNVTQRFCQRGKEITNIILGCSKYECSGIFYSFNIESGKWGEG